LPITEAHGTSLLPVYAKFKGNVSQKTITEIVGQSQHLEVILDGICRKQMEKFSLQLTPQPSSKSHYIFFYLL